MPHGLLAHLGDHLGRHPEPGAEEVLDRVPGAAGRVQPAQLLEEVVGSLEAVLVDCEGRLVERQLRDREPARGGLEGERPARRHPEHECRSAGRLDQRLEVLDLALDRVGRAVAALAAPAAVVVEDA